MSSKDDAALNAAGIRRATQGEIARGECCLFCEHWEAETRIDADEIEYCLCLKHNLYVYEPWNCAWMRGERNA